jgi:hypothetical protein
MHCVNSSHLIANLPIGGQERHSGEWRSQLEHCPKQTLIAGDKSAANGSKLAWRCVPQAGLGSAKWPVRLITLVTTAGQQVNAIPMDPINEVSQSRAGKQPRAYERDPVRSIWRQLKVERLSDPRFNLVFRRRDLSNLLLMFLNCHCGSLPENYEAGNMPKGAKW